MNILEVRVGTQGVRPVSQGLACLCLVALCGCQPQPDVLFTAVGSNAAVVGLTDVHDLCEAGARLAFLTDEIGTLRGCWVRTKGDIRASFANLPEVRIPSREFEGTDVAAGLNIVIESFEESPLYAVGTAARN